MTRLKSLKLKWFVFKNHGPIGNSCLCYFCGDNKRFDYLYHLSTVQIKRNGVIGIGANACPWHFLQIISGDIYHVYDGSDAFISNLYLTCA